MNGRLAIPLTCGALLLGGGCGSSSGSSTSTRTALPSASGTTSGGLKLSTTPKFARPAASTPVRSGTIQIAYRNITIAPDTLKVKVGSTIVWTNHDPLEHNVTSAGGPAKFASGNFGEGKSFRLAVTQPGLIRYLCTIHPTSMNGSIAVVR